MDFSGGMQIYCSSEIGIPYKRKQYKSYSSLQHTAVQTKNFFRNRGEKMPQSQSDSQNSLVNTNMLILVLQLFSGAKAK